LNEAMQDVGEVVAVLQAWTQAMITGPSVDPQDQGEEVALPVADLEDEDEDDDEEGSWVFSCPVPPEGEQADFQDLLETFGIFDDNEPVVVLDSAEWAGLKSIIEAIHKATGKGSMPKAKGKKAKGGVQKALIAQLKELCSTGMLLVITNSQKGDFHSDLICQLVQLTEGVLEELGSAMGKVLCVLPGWQGPALEGPSLDDPTDTVRIPVTPASDWTGDPISAAQESPGEVAPGQGGSRKEKAPSPATSGQGDRAKGEGKKEQTTKEEKTVVEVESGGEKSSKKKGKKKQHEEETKKQDPVPATNQTVFASQASGYAVGSVGASLGLSAVDSGLDALFASTKTK